MADKPAARLTVKVSPKSSGDRLAGWNGETLKIALTAPPADGEANKSLLKFLAKNLRLKAADLSLIQGAASRTKIVKIEGLDQAELEARLGKPASTEEAVKAP